MAGPTRRLPFPTLAKTLIAVAAFGACGEEHEPEQMGDIDSSQQAASEAGVTEAGATPNAMDGGDAGAGSPGGSSSLLDAATLDATAQDAVTQDAATQDAVASDGSSAGNDASSSDASEAGPCSAGTANCPLDPLAPFKLDCANLPSNGVCVGGPREVLLVTEETGLIAMFDPGDGHFLGYFKHRSAKYDLNGITDYRLADQGPDQCIWSVSEDSRGTIERWNADGTYRDAPLKPHYFDLPQAPPEPLRGTTSIAFTRDKVYVASQLRAQGYPEITRWNLDGNFDRVELDGTYSLASLLVLGDGSIVYADGEANRVARIPADGGQHHPVVGAISWPGQIAYAGAGDLLVVDTSTGEALHKVDIESGMTTTIYPYDTNQSAKYGIAALRNGKWLIAGGELAVSVLDPASTNPPGQHVPVFTDLAAESTDFQHIGRACLPEAFVASRGSKPADNTCIAAPDGPTLFSENFEGTDDFQGAGSARHYHAFFDRGSTGVTSSIAATEGFESSRALKVAGSGSLPASNGQMQGGKTGVFAALPLGSHPKYISYRVKVTDAQDRELGSFVFHNAALNTDETIRLIGTDFYHGYFRDLESYAASATPLLNVWVKVEYRNIDWAKRTSDLYLNCQRLAEGIFMPAAYGDSIDLIDLYNYPTSPANAKTVAWYDDILIK